VTVGIDMIFGVLTPNRVDMQEGAAMAASDGPSPVGDVAAAGMISTRYFRDIGSRFTKAMKKVGKVVEMTRVKQTAKQRRKAAKALTAAKKTETQVKKKSAYDPKTKGQNYGEITDRQRGQRQGGDRTSINQTKKAKQKDKQELQDPDDE